MILAADSAKMCHSQEEDAAAASKTLLEPCAKAHLPGDHCWSSNGSLCPLYSAFHICFLLVVLNGKYTGKRALKS